MPRLRCTIPRTGEISSNDFAAVSGRSIRASGQFAFVPAPVSAPALTDAPPAAPPPLAPPAAPSPPPPPAAGSSANAFPAMTAIDAAAINTIFETRFIQLSSLTDGDGPTRRARVRLRARLRK